MTNQIAQRTKIAVGLNDHVTARASVTPVRTATRHKGLSTEAAAAVPAVTRATI
jgi:hypothetical protein